MAPGVLAIRRMSLRLTLAMIVRDAAEQIEACLASARAVVDEMVVADTGSRDDTVARARGLGAHVIEIPWEEDFARARNRGLEAVGGDWVLVLDADERLDLEETPAQWRAQMESGPDAFQVTIRNYMRTSAGHIWDREARPNPADNQRRWPESAPYPSFVEHENVRLFRRDPDLYFIGRLHESVGPRVLAAGKRLGKARGRLHHFGLALEAEAQAAKNLHYLELARRKCQDQPDDAQAHFELGVMFYDQMHQDGEALGCFERALRLNPGLGVAWFYGGAALLRMGHAAEALQFLQQAESAGQRSRLLDEMTGDAYYGLGRFGEATQRYRRLKLASKQGLAELRSGRTEQGLGHLRAAVENRPEALEHHDRLIAAYAHIEAWDSAEAAILARIQQFPDRPDGPRRLAALQQERQTRGEAKARFAAGR